MNTLSKYAYRAMTVEAESGEKVASWLGEPPVTVNEVIDERTAQTWVVDNFAKVIATWRNGKRISSNGRYWDASGYSVPQAVTQMITLYYTTNVTDWELSRAKPFKRIEGVRIGRGRRLPGRYADSVQETGNVVVNGEEARYDVLSSQIRVSGKSGTSYPLAGHTREFLLTPHGWAFYYAQLRRSMAVIFSSDVITRQQLDLVPRAVILLRNSLVPNMIWLATVNAVIEYLPEGICQAELIIEVNDITDTPGSRNLRSANSILLIILLSANCYILCKVGPGKYFTTLLFSLNGAFLLFCFVNTYASTYTSSLEVGLANNITDSAAPFEKQGFAHTANSQIIDFLGRFTLLVLAFESVVIIRYVFRYERMARAFAR